MTIDLLKEMSQAPVPPLPNDFRGEVHRRLNYRLLLSHLAEFALCGLLFAFIHFFQSVLGLIWFSLSGQFGETRPRQDE